MAGVEGLLPEPRQTASLVVQFLMLPIFRAHRRHECVWLCQQQNMRNLWSCNAFGANGAIGLMAVAAKRGAQTFMSFELCSKESAIPRRQPGFAVPVSNYSIKPSDTATATVVVGNDGSSLTGSQLP